MENSKGRILEARGFDPELPQKYPPERERGKWAGRNDPRNNIRKFARVEVCIKKVLPSNANAKRPTARQIIMKFQTT